MFHKLFWLGLAVLAATMTMLAPPSAADDPKSPTEARQEAQANGVELLAEAYRLAEFARTQKAPEAYVTAGSLLLKLHADTKGQIGELDVKPEVLDENDKPIADAKVETQKPQRFDALANDFFDSASALGVELKVSKEVEALIKAARSRRYTPDVETRGAVGGPKLIVRRLPPKQSHVYDIPFDTHSVGSIGFEASAPTRCKMAFGAYVHFNQVVRVGQYTWRPRPKEPIRTFTITIKNQHDTPVTYKLFTN
jgi:hypothetical protein